MDPDLFNGKSIAIVGNSACVFDRTDGTEIDRHDLVLRFNFAWPERANRPECTGSRTTHMRIGGRHFRTETAAADLARQMRNNPDVHFHSAKGDPTKWTLASPVPLAPDDVYQRWRDELGTKYEPSSGASLLYYLTHYCTARRISLFAIDGLQTPDWCKPRGHVHAYCHSPEVECRYLAHVTRQFPYVALVPPEAAHYREVRARRALARMFAWRR